MSNNIPKITDDQAVNLVRGAMSHRASWMARMYFEMQKYLPQETAEKIVRAAVKSHGYDKATAAVEKVFHGEMPTSEKMSQAVFSDFSKKVFEVDVKALNDDTLQMEFSYCPLLKAWRDMGCSESDCAILCDMAMEGDRGIAAGTGHEFFLGETIAENFPHCQLKYSRKK